MTEETQSAENGAANSPSTSSFPWPWILGPIAVMLTLIVSGAIVANFTHRFWSYAATPFGAAFAGLCAISAAGLAFTSQHRSYLAKTREIDRQFEVLNKDSRRRDVEMRNTHLRESKADLASRFSASIKEIEADTFGQKSAGVRSLISVADGWAALEDDSSSREIQRIVDTLIDYVRDDLPYLANEVEVGPDTRDMEGGYVFHHNTITRARVCRLILRELNRSLTPISGARNFYHWRVPGLNSVKRGDGGQPAIEASLRRSNTRGLMVLFGDWDVAELNSIYSDIFAVEADFSWINGDLMLFARSNLSRSNFDNIDLTKVSFNDCLLYGTDFTGSDLRGTRFHNCLVSGTPDFQSPHMQGAKVSARTMFFNEYVELLSERSYLTQDAVCKTGGIADDLGVVWSD